MFRKFIASALLATVPVVGLSTTAHAADGDTSAATPVGFSLPPTCDYERWSGDWCVMPDGTKYPWTFSIKDECIQTFGAGNWKAAEKFGDPVCAKLLGKRVRVTHPKLPKQKKVVAPPRFGPLCRTEFDALWMAQVSKRIGHGANFCKPRNVKVGAPKSFKDPVR